MNKAIAGMMFLVAALVSLNASAASYTRSISSPNGLYQGDMLISQNGQYRMLLQGDGNLVVSRISDNSLVWANYAYGTTVVIVQPDGNFVAYNTSTSPTTAVWNTQTGGKAGTGSTPVTLYLEDNGTLKLYNTSGSLIWTTAVVQPYCGDGVCGFGENSNTCRIDCPAYCGDGICGTFENSNTCRIDCPSYCGNGYCDMFESRSNCPFDCPF
ncbi:hypothetical protein JRI60_28920 [Archangium violaceum]|uniref:hypothetical protein n=1 Tax=Archangium violaceum TaxID=83451 RepID=UPI00195118BF|nr:hypothetical protein [Archangium violaceum]QRN93218.1 hypothetical protein JRI60_28920 [Archangium violaceum]